MDRLTGHDRASGRLVAVPAALVVVVLGFLYAGDSRPGRVDGWVQPGVEGVRGPWRTVALATDFWGEPVGAALSLLAAVSVCCLVFRRHRWAVFVVGGTAAAVVTTTVLKYLVGRTIHGDDNLSYPSGHTAFATAFALTVALLVAGRLRLGGAAGTAVVLGAALVAGAVMGWAEVALGAHYPTDVLGGWCTALAVVPATGWVVDRVAGGR
ncbi:phosphatase PAP2 family protein [Streptomyces sp. NPDC048182]|uniref:phosphatase PAP2 family protein n=1 Tax=unclassified Streptomyces TaxID=2593676 RepID=UPI0033A1E5E4